MVALPIESLLILQMDGSDFQYIAALDKKTGRTVWKTDRSTDFDDLEPDGHPIRDGDFRKAFNTPPSTTYYALPLDSVLSKRR